MRPFRARDIAVSAECIEIIDVDQAGKLVFQARAPIFKWPIMVV
ncbi:hypothetical protein NBRC103581_01344 [Gluconobacter wancherniae NBRC 103581]|nr:hypothetical protein [Gluconobacter wancherniae]GBD56763.1 hypothetical protein NBRC103581_01344 [Gluconobacter wancherniae NBRC 103581]